MLLTLINASSDEVKIHLSNIDKTFILRPWDKHAINIDEELINLEISANKISKYHLLKNSDFCVMSKYKLLNSSSNFEFHIIRQEMENEAMCKYIRFVIQEFPFYDSVEYTIVNYDEIIKKDKKGVAIGHLMLFAQHFFSFANLAFIILSVVIGSYMGVIHGIVCYVIVFGLFFLIIELINWCQDRNLETIADCMTDKYIKNLFK